jgi:hypothetical protein
MLRVILRVVISLLPLGLTPVLGRLIAQGYINLGGGEKDIVILLPWLLWSLLFAFSSWVFWRRGRPIGPSLWRSALVGLAGLVIAAVALGFFGVLGVGGLF